MIQSSTWKQPVHEQNNRGILLQILWDPPLGIQSSYILLLIIWFHGEFAVELWQLQLVIWKVSRKWKVFCKVQHIKFQDLLSAYLVNIFSQELNYNVATTCFQDVQISLTYLVKGAFNNYLDQILTNFDPLEWTSVDILHTPPLSTWTKGAKKLQLSSM